MTTKKINARMLLLARTQLRSLSAAAATLRKTSHTGAVKRRVATLVQRIESSVTAAEQLVAAILRQEARR